MMRSTGRRCLLLAVAALGGAAALAPAADGAPPMNQWQPLTPGLQSVARGFVNAGSRRLPHTRVYTVTDVVKVIHGVRSVAVLDQDIDGGQIVEQAIDYLSIDAKGTVWYRGSYTEGYEGGRFTSALDGWLDGRQGAKAGIFMPANPRVGSRRLLRAAGSGRGGHERPGRQDASDEVRPVPLLQECRRDPRGR